MMKSVIYFSQWGLGSWGGGTTGAISKHRTHTINQRIKSDVISHLSYTSCPQDLAIGTHRQPCACGVQSSRNHPAGDNSRRMMRFLGHYLVLTVLFAPISINHVHQAKKCGQKRSTAVGGFILTSAAQCNSSTDANTSLAQGQGAVEIVEVTPESIAGLDLSSKFNCEDGNFKVRLVRATWTPVNCEQYTWWGNNFFDRDLLHTTEWQSSHQPFGGAFLYYGMHLLSLQQQTSICSGRTVTAQEGQLGSCIWHDALYVVRANSLWKGFAVHWAIKGWCWSRWRDVREPNLRARKDVRYPCCPCHTNNNKLTIF